MFGMVKNYFKITIELVAYPKQQEQPCSCARLTAHTPDGTTCNPGRTPPTKSLYTLGKSYQGKVEEADAIERKGEKLVSKGFKDIMQKDFA